MTDTTLETPPATGTAPHIDKPEDEAPAGKSFLEAAQDMLEDALETTVDAVKKHPYAAAGIAAGTAAAVGGAVYAATKLGGSSEPEPAKGAAKTKK